LNFLTTEQRSTKGSEVFSELCGYMHPFANATQTYSFPDYLALTERLVAEGRTTGPDQSDFLAGFTKLNLARTKRWMKTTTPAPELVAALKAGGGAEWWVITEAWCGDSAQNLPLLAEAAETAGVPLRIILRDENLDIMDRYLTDGSRSIPKLISLTAEGRERFIWGPRPAPAHALYAEWRANPAGRDFEAFETELHTWYAKDKGRTLTEEIIALAKS